MFRLNQLISYLPQAALYLLYAAITLLTVNAYLQYAGEGYVYLLFSLISNGLLYLGFNKKAIFFDAFIGIFFWLGFWLKVTIRVGFAGGVFFEHTGNFDGSGAAFDYGLLVASCGLFALIIATLVRRKFFSFPAEASDTVFLPGLFGFYKKYRKSVLLIFVIAFLFIALSNLYWGVYQRGQVARTVLPYGLGGIYKWLLQFGLASFAAVILKFEFTINNKKPYLVGILGLMESFASNVSLLSRGMILNTTALFYGVFKNLKDGLFNTANLRFFFAMGVVFVTLFASSVAAVNYFRYNGPAVLAQFLGHSNSEAPKLTGVQENVALVSGMTTPLFIDRWVGIEGVLAVSSSQKTGMELWQQAWQEPYLGYGTSFYDKNLIKSSYLEIDAKNHYISLPGIIAFCFYPGSFWLLFAAMILVGLIGAAIEIFVYLLGGKNLILCSLLAQVVAFRYASFGYVPSQSYLLFGTLFLNVIIIYGLDKILGIRYRNAV